MSLGGAARLAIGCVFLVAAVSKARLPNWASDTADALGLPLLPVRLSLLIELAIGATAVVQTRAAATAAIGLLVVYTGVLVVELSRRGIHAPSCACFGANAKPITWRAVARNAVLIGVAVVGSVVA